MYDVRCTMFAPPVADKDFSDQKGVRRTPDIVHVYALFSFSCLSLNL
jgi:hypothetical protein